jgi:hypothetical protein
MAIRFFALFTPLMSLPGLERPCPARSRPGRLVWSFIDRIKVFAGERTPSLFYRIPELFQRASHQVFALILHLAF